MDVDVPDPAKDERPPSEIYMLLDDKLEPKGLYHQVRQHISSDARQAFEKMQFAVTHLHWQNSVEYVLLVYAMLHKGVLDIPAIPEDEYNFKTSPEDFFGFKGVAFNCSITKSRLRPYDLEEAAENLTKKDKDGNGPYFIAENEEGVYRLIDNCWVEPLVFSFIIKSSSHSQYVCDFDMLFKYMRPKDIPEDADGPKAIEVGEYDFRPLAQRIMDQIIDGNVNDFIACKMMKSRQFRNEFFRTVKKKDKMTELLLAADKISKPDKPKTMIYFSVAQPFPNTDLLITLLEEMEHSSVSKEDQERQLSLTLEASCRWGHFDAFEFLFKRIGVLSFECLRKAILGGNPDIVDIIIRREDWNQDQLNKTLEWSCFCGEQSIFRSLRQMGAECTERCFYEAACGGNFNMFLDLCREGFDIEAKLANGKTLLHATAEHGNESILEFLLQRGLEVNARCTKGLIPLQLAVQNGHTDVTEMLLQRDSEFNVEDDSGTTPLHVVCVSAYIPLLKQLLTLGADITVLDNRGRSILHKAAFGGSLEVIRHLPPDMDIEAKDKFGNTILHMAAVQGHLSVVTHFVDLRPQLLSARNNSNWNLILCATYGGHHRVFEFLLQNGVDALEVASDGRNAKILAEHGRQLKQLKSKKFDELFGEEIVFGSIENFDIILERLSKYFK